MMTTKRVECPACGGAFTVDAMAFLDMNEAELVDQYRCDTSGATYARKNEAEDRNGNDTYTAAASGGSR